MGHPSFGMTVAIRKVTGTNRKDGSRLWGREMRAAKHQPSQWIAATIVVVAEIQGMGVKNLARASGVKRCRLRRVLNGELTLTIDEAQALCLALGTCCSDMAELSMTRAHNRPMAVTMADRVLF